MQNDLVNEVIRSEIIEQMEKPRDSWCFGTVDSVQEANIVGVILDGDTEPVLLPTMVPCKVEDRVLVLLLENSRIVTSVVGMTGLLGQHQVLRDSDSGTDSGWVFFRATISVNLSVKAGDVLQVSASHRCTETSSQAIGFTDGYPSHSDQWPTNLIDRVYSAVLMQTASVIWPVPADYDDLYVVSAIWRRASSVIEWGNTTHIVPEQYTGLWVSHFR